MNRLLELVERGGWVMPLILTLSVILYWRCFVLLLALIRGRSRVSRSASELGANPHLVRRLESESLNSFRRHRAMLGSMIAAAPLLGLLGTVSGMERTFMGLSSQGGERSMEALAGGISEVLIATESGLAVAIPAMLFVYLAHRETNRMLEILNRIGRAAAGKEAV